MSTIVLIDLSSILYPTYHMAASDPNPDATSIQSLDRIRGLSSGQPYVAICVDSKRSVRREADPTYKANRKAEDRAPLYHQMALVIDALKVEGFPIWSVDGYEADDVIAAATVRALTEPDTQVQIVSADKDLLALVGDRVTLKSLKDGSTIDAAAVKAKFGVEPRQIPDLLTLMGDASDNIKGAKRIGEATAAKLLNAYGTLEGIYNALMADASSFTPGLRESLGEFLSRVDDVRNLVKLNFDLPIPFEEIAVERQPPLFETPEPVPDFSADTPTGLPVGTVEGTVETQPEPPAGPLPTSTLAALKAKVEASIASAPPGPARSKPKPPAAPVVVPVADSVADTPVPVADRVADTPISEPVVEVVQPERPKPVVDDTAAKVAQEAARQQAEKMQQVQAAGPKQSFGLEPKALVPQVIEADFTRQLEPQTLEDAIRLAKYAFESRLFGAYGSPQACLMVIMSGREMGMAMMHSLRAFDILDGKPTLKADAIRAIILRSGKAEYFRITERTPTRATFATKRKGEPEIVLSYTIEEAQIAGYVKAGSGYTKNPADMLVARASSKLGRLVYPDVIHGIISPEELTDGF